MLSVEVEKDLKVPWLSLDTLEISRYADISTSFFASCLLVACLLLVGM